MLLMLSLMALIAAQDPGAEAPLTELPEVVVERPQESVVVLNCAVTVDGRLQDCRIVSEAPPGRGYGAAALADAARSRYSPETMDGARARAKVTFTSRPAGARPRRPLT